MTLGQLKKSLAKLPSDMHDMEVMVTVSRGGKKQMEPLCLVAYLPIPENECVTLGTLTAVQNMVENGEMDKPDGYIDPTVSDRKLFDDGEEGH